MFGARFTHTRIIWTICNLFGVFFFFYIFLYFFYLDFFLDIHGMLGISKKKNFILNFSQKNHFIGVSYPRFMSSLDKCILISVVINC